MLSDFYIKEVVPEQDSWGVRSKRCDKWSKEYKEKRVGHFVDEDWIGWLVWAVESNKNSRGVQEQ